MGTSRVQSTRLEREASPCWKWLHPAGGLGGARGQDRGPRPPPGPAHPSARLSQGAGQGRTGSLGWPVCVCYTDLPSAPDSPLWRRERATFFLTVAEFQACFFWFFFLLRITCHNTYLPDTEYSHSLLCKTAKFTVSLFLFPRFYLFSLHSSHFK